MKLAIAPLLRALVAKHRAEIPQPRRLPVQQAMLDAGAHDAGGAFGPQAQAVAAEILEGVHLLLDDVGDLADRALRTAPSARPAAPGSPRSHSPRRSRAVRPRDGASAARRPAAHRACRGLPGYSCSRSFLTEYARYDQSDGGDCRPFGRAQSPVVAADNSTRSVSVVSPAAMRCAIRARIVRSRSSSRSSRLTL
jgi:hypothetical protein